MIFYFLFFYIEHIVSVETNSRKWDTSKQDYKNKNKKLYHQTGTKTELENNTNPLLISANQEKVKQLIPY